MRGESKDFLHCLAFSEMQQTQRVLTSDALCEGMSAGEEEVPFRT